MKGYIQARRWSVLPVVVLLAGLLLIYGVMWLAYQRGVTPQPVLL